MPFRSVFCVAAAMVTVTLASCAELQAPETSDFLPLHAARPATTSGPPVLPLTSFEHCSDTEEGFDDWRLAFREHAIAEGISREVATHALDGVSYDPKVIELDRTQKPQHLTFEAFSASHVTPARIRRGRKLLVTDADLLATIEARFGVAPEILVAIWGLETDYGAYQGTTRSLDALATLAYDCRRAERFRGELSSALRIVQRGDLREDEMVGAWAGELGQTQFLPSSYLQFGIDFDGDGRIDLLGSKEDVLASTANYLAGHGWHPHEGYGPGSGNLTVLETWNQSAIYQKTILLFAAKLVAPK